MHRIQALILVVMLFCVCVVGVLGQTPQTTPPPAPQPTPQAPPPTQSARPMIYFPNTGIRRMPDASNRPMDATDMIAARQAALVDYLHEIYGKPTSDELKLVEPSPDLRRQYAAFLGTPRTGILRFAANAECTTNKFVISASDACRAYRMPGAGASFSFRKENYQVRQLADLTLDRGALIAGGVFSNAAIVNLGDIAIESVSADLAAVKYLAMLAPATDVVGARRFEDRMITGTSENGVRYARSAVLVANNTFGLRVIAYRGRIERAIRGIQYNELDYDKRRDVLVIFRVVDVAADGGATIIWKMVFDQPAGRLKGDGQLVRAWVREYEDAEKSK